MGQPGQPDQGAARVESAIDRWQRELLDLSRSNRLLYLHPGRGRRGQSGVGIVQPSPPDLFDRLANRERRQTIVRPPAPVEQGLRLDLSDTSDPYAIGGQQNADAAAVGDGDAGAGHVGAMNRAPTDNDPVGAHFIAPESGAQPASVTPPVLRRDEILLDVEAARHDALLYRLRLRARSALLEQGIEILYVAFGLLEWSGVGTAAGPAERALSPLLLLPVSLERERSVDPYTLTPLDERPILNPALAFQLASAYQITLTLPDSDDDGDLDYSAALASLRAQLATLPDSSVQDGAYLGLFSFAKQAMYADLAATRARLARHPIVRALAGDPAGLPRLALPEPERLDELEHPRDTFQVLDADASQRTVLAAIRRGGSLVVQGPPGTGKSQTIANSIAEALGRGKSVLFVSEKLAALNVVAKRLRAAGLGEFCLEAHGHGGDKKAIVAALAAALPETANRPVPPRLDDLQVLAERRAELNAYARALHDHQNPLGASAFAIHGELAKRAGAPRALFGVPQIGQLTMERTGRLVNLVRRLQPLAGVVTAPEQHPWFGCTLPRWNPLVQAQLETTLARLARAADELAEVQARAGRGWGLAPATSVPEARRLLQVLTLLDGRPPILARWLTRPTLNDLRERVQTWGTRCEGYDQRRLRLLSHYRDDLFGLDLPPIISALAGIEVAAIGRLNGSGPAPDRALAARPVVERASSKIMQAVPAALGAAEVLAGALGLAAPGTLAEIGRLLQIADLVRAEPHPEPGWLDPGRPGLLANLATAAAHQAERAAANLAALTERFDESVVEAVTPALAQRFETTYTTWMRQLRPGWYADLGLLRRHLRVEQRAADLDYPTAMTAIGEWRVLMAAEAWHASQAEALAAAFGRHYQGMGTDWVGVQGALDVIRRLTALLGDVRRRPRVSQLLLEGGASAALDHPIQAVRAALADLDDGLAELWSVAPVLPAPSPGSGLTEVVSNLERWLAALTPFWAAADALHRCRRVATASAAELLAEAQDALACLRFERDFEAATPALTVEVGPAFTGLKTEWPRLVDALAWTAQLRACFDGEPPAPFVAALEARPSDSVPAHVDLTRALHRLHELIEEIGASFRAQDGDGGPSIGSLPIARASLVAVAAWARSRHAALPRLQEWIDAQGVLQEIQAAGLDGLVEGLIREAPAPALWVDIFLRQTFTLWLTWRYEQAPALARFRRQGHEAAVDEMGRLDQRQWQLASERISASLLARRPGRSGLTLNGSEVGLLLREARKQRRIKPLRRLFAELPLLLPQLKPCLLMSPLSVAQHLGSSATIFDLVVFDEASQILPADAIGVVGRGRQVVVVGDRRQLPPTRFFQVATLDTLADDPDEEPPESVLDACLNAGLPECSLLWHYRSRHEHLIAFSNAAFYDGRLRTFPSPAADGRVVTLDHVTEGVYDRGGTRANRVEAARVADLVVEHVQQQADLPLGERLSLGVIAFSEAQMLAILSELEARKPACPELEPLLNDDGEDGLFVKNLESVQGDERDVILFSIGYGRDSAGRLTMSFGPLNAPGGERRLNVAVTRARQRITVVTSIRAHEIDASPERPAGVRALRQYLEYAERGPSVLPGLAGQAGHMVPAGPGASPFEEAVQAALTDVLKGHEVEVVGPVGVGQHPVDLAVRDRDGRYLLAIESDGQTFAELPTARDRDRLRQEVLQRLGWQVHRIWSTAWIVDQQDEQQRVLASVERARQIRDGTLADDVPLAVLKPEDRPSQGPARPNARVMGAVPALTPQPGGPALTPGPQTDLRPIDRVPEADIVEAVRTVLARAFAMPGDDLVVAVARELGYQRTGGRIKAALGRVTQRMRTDGRLVEAGGHLRLAAPTSDA